VPWLCGSRRSGSATGSAPAPFAAFSKISRQPAGEMPPYTAKVFPTVNCATFTHSCDRCPPPPLDSIPLLKRERMNKLLILFFVARFWHRLRLPKQAAASLAAGAAIGRMDESTSAHSRRERSLDTSRPRSTGQHPESIIAAGPGGSRRISPWPTFHFNRGLASCTTIARRTSNVMRHTRDASRLRVRVRWEPLTVSKLSSCGTFSACLFSTSEARIVFVSSIWWTRASERPRACLRRTLVGHWEGDTLL